MSTITLDARGQRPVGIYIYPCGTLFWNSLPSAIRTQEITNKVNEEHLT